MTEPIDLSAPILHRGVIFYFGGRRSATTLGADLGNPWAAPAVVDIIQEHIWTNEVLRDLGLVSFLKIRRGLNQMIFELETYLRGTKNDKKLP